MTVAAMTATQPVDPILAYYIVVDGGDGSAGVSFFASEEAAKLELERMESSPFSEYSLSDGEFRPLYQSDIDSAATLEEVRAEFDEQIAEEDDEE